MQEFNYDDIEIGYYDNIFRLKKGIQSKWHHLKFQGIHNILKTIPFETHLDFACSSGTFISTMPEKKYCCGIDISKKQIDFANHNYKTTYHQFKAHEKNKIPFKSNQFDLITSIELIEHLSTKDIKVNLLEMKRCLTNNGYLLVTTPDYESNWPILEYGVSRLSKLNYEEQHISKFNRSLLKETLQEYGFSIVLLRRFIDFSPFLSLLNWKLSSQYFKFEFNRFPNRGNLLLALAKKR